MIASSEHSLSVFSSDEKFRKRHKATPYGVNEHAYPVRKYINAFRKAGIIDIIVSPSQGWDKIIAVRSPSTLKEIARKILRLLLRTPVLQPLVRKTFLTLLSSDIMICGIKKSWTKMHDNFTYKRVGKDVYGVLLISFSQVPIRTLIKITEQNIMESTHWSLSW